MASVVRTSLSTLLMVISVAFLNATRGLVQEYTSPNNTQTLIRDEGHLGTEPEFIQEVKLQGKVKGIHKSKIGDQTFQMQESQAVENEQKPQQNGPKTKEINLIDLLQGHGQGQGLVQERRNIDQEHHFLDNKKQRYENVQETQPDDRVKTETIARDKLLNYLLAYRTKNLTDQLQKNAQKTAKSPIWIKMGQSNNTKSETTAPLLWTRARNDSKEKKKLKNSGSLSDSFKKIKTCLSCNADSKGSFKKTVSRTWSKIGSFKDEMGRRISGKGKVVTGRTADEKFYGPPFRFSDKPVELPLAAPPRKWPFPPNNEGARPIAPADRNVYNKAEPLNARVRPIRPPSPDLTPDRPETLGEPATPERHEEPETPERSPRRSPKTSPKTSPRTSPKRSPPRAPSPIPSPVSPDEPEEPEEPEEPKEPEEPERRPSPRRSPRKSPPRAPSPIPSPVSPDELQSPTGYTGRGPLPKNFYKRPASEIGSKGGFESPTGVQKKPPPRQRPLNEREEWDALYKAHGPQTRRGRN